MLCNEWNREFNLTNTFIIYYVKITTLFKNSPLYTRFILITDVIGANDVV